MKKLKALRTVLKKPTTNPRMSVLARSDATLIRRYRTHRLFIQPRKANLNWLGSTRRQWKVVLSDRLPEAGMTPMRRNLRAKILTTKAEIIHGRKPSWLVQPIRLPSPQIFHPTETHCLTVKHWCRTTRCYHLPQTQLVATTERLEKKVMEA